MESLLGVQNDRFGEKVVADFFQESQGSGEEREIEEFAVDARNQGFLAVQAENAAEHPIGRMKSMGEPYGIDVQVVLLHGAGQILGYDFAHVAPRGAEVFLGKEIVRVFREKGGDGDGDLPPGLEDSAQLGDTQPITIDMLYDLGADGLVESAVLEREAQSVAP